jgi:predicted acylesterase/phospholipase RssA
MPSPAAASAPNFDPLVEEVRVAMALNGGVSLAVWMGGCAIELDAARRAHLGPEVVATPDEPAPERRIYNALTRAFKREFVVDIMSGASAGGINGALLAGAMRKGRRLHPKFLRDRWLEIGDFETVLLQRTTDADPASLMRGTEFARAIDDAFSVLLGEEPPPSGEPDLCDPAGQAVHPFDPVLDITMTNVAGEPRAFRDEWGEELVAREYRAVFEFRNDVDFNASTLGLAARTTASFPAAFEPNLVEGQAAGLAKLGEPRWAIDGGVLNNAPVRNALAQIPTRSARRRVRRFVCYVNADPPGLEPAETSDEQPPLPAILGYVVNLPRNAPFADELTAAEHAVREGRFSRTAQDALLDADRASLTAIAEKLLPAYRDRRRLRSLETLAEDPASARKIYERLGANELPWIPSSITPPSTAGEWRWGIRTAQRAIHLQLDVLREALDSPTLAPASRSSLLDAWSTANDQLDALQQDYRRFSERPEIAAVVRALDDDEDPTDELNALDALTAGFRTGVFAALQTATDAVASVVSHMPPTLANRLFPAGAGPAASLRTFLEGALGIEVVRRAFSDDDDFQTAQNLAFAQLTPVVPILIWTSTPFRGPSGNHLPDSPNKKLTGIILGHFGAFYRRSWRANDFLWGRLDAATRIVDMLVDPERAQRLGEATWRTLATELLAADSELAAGHRALVHEALTDARTPTELLDPAVSQALAGYPDAPDDSTLRTCLEQALRADLKAAGVNGGRLTRVVMARAVQLEILRHELPVLVEETAADERLGCFTKPIELEFGDDDGEVDDAVLLASLRGCRPLPELLGRESGDEGVSSLALRTISHALFVTLAVLKTAQVPLAKSLAVARAPLLPIAGIASMKLAYRGVTAVGFAAAALYVAARLATAKDAEIQRLGDLWSAPVLLYFMALLGIAGVIAVPAVRGLRAQAKPDAVEAERKDAKVRRRKQWGWAAALALSAGLVALGLAWYGRELGFAGILVTPGADEPWGALWKLDLAQWTLVVLLGGGVAIRIGRALPFAQKPLTLLLERIPQPVWLLLAAIAVGSWAGWTLVDLFVQMPFHEVVGGTTAWQKAIAAVAAVGAVVVGPAYVFVGKQR